MGVFSAKIVAEFTPPKTWILEEPLSFVTKLMNKEQGAVVEEDIELNKQLETAKAFMSREE